MDEIRIKVERDYMQGMKYKDICDKYELSINTLKSWIKRYDWSNKRKDKNKKGAPKKKRGAPRTKPKDKTSKQEDKINKNIIKEVVANAELTDKQQLFCVYYLKYFNATKAYQKVYKCDYITANASGPRMLVNVSIKHQIEKLKAERMESAYLEGKDILQKYIDIAFTDITDFIEFGVEDVPEINNSTGKQSVDENGDLIFYKRNYINFKNDYEVDGTIISEVSQGKDGVKIKLQDKMKALDFLAKNIGQLNEMDKVKIETEKVRTRKLQIEIEKLKKEVGKAEDKPIEIRLISSDNK